MNTNNKILFSIIIPIYNRDEFIHKTISSVLEQTYSNFEIICVNDGSKDQSENIIQTFQKKDIRIRLISLNQNKGRCIARNKGIENAKGDWICFLDSDDLYLKNHLETLNKLIIKNNNYNVYCTSQAVNNEEIKVVKNEKNSILILKDFIRTNPIQINQLCIKKELKIFFPHERIPISEDWLFFRRIALQNKILKSSIVTNILVNHNNRSVNNTDWREFVKWNAYTGLLFTKEEISSYLKKKLTSFTYLLCANILLTNKYKKESISYFKKSLSNPYTFFDPLFYKGIIKYLIK